MVDIRRVGGLYAGAGHASEANPFVPCSDESKSFDEGYWNHEIDRLRSALFNIQCDMLDRATDKKITSSGHRDRAMATRDEIIAVLSKP